MRLTELFVRGDIYGSGFWEAGQGLASADEYRGYAVECMALAERVTDPADKARLVQMAQAFLDLADRRHKVESN